jgi:2-polyprenyl-3-methyl-5-hydroxy-6-metoxy-1,4-benzoquinol methylase
MELNYHLPKDYKHRTEYLQFDDTVLTDEYQDDIYRKVAGFVEKNSLEDVADIGCGSGFKLIKYFDERTTIGYDVGETVEFLEDKYPDKLWEISDYDVPGCKVDMVMCIDCIEHVLEPNKLLDYIKTFNPAFVAISTPVRSLVSRATNGPPSNPHHVREWSMKEFHAYISDHFDIVHHKAYGESQLTICAIKGNDLLCL